MTASSPGKPRTSFTVPGKLARLFSLGSRSEPVAVELKCIEVLKYVRVLMRALRDPEVLIAPERSSDTMFRLLYHAWPKKIDGYEGRPEMVALFVLGFSRIVLAHVSINLVREIAAMIYGPVAKKGGVMLFGVEVLRAQQSEILPDYHNVDHFVVDVPFRRTKIFLPT